VPLGAVVVGTVATVPVATVVDLKVTAAAAVATSVAVDAVIAVPTGLCSSQCYCSVVSSTGRKLGRVWRTGR